MDAFYTYRGDALPLPCATGANVDAFRVDERCLYLLGYASSGVKVGIATKPDVRLNQHATIASFHLDPVVRVWVSGPHENARANERAVKSFCASRAKKVIGTEYFLGVDINAVEEFAATLPVDRGVPRQIHPEPPLPALLNDVPDTGESLPLEQVARLYPELNYWWLRRMCYRREIQFTRHRKGYVLTPAQIRAAMRARCAVIPARVPKTEAA